MRRASRLVLGGHESRTDATVVRYPDHYSDPRGVVETSGVFDAALSGSVPFASGGPPKISKAIAQKFKIDMAPMTIKRILDRAGEPAFPTFVQRNKLFHKSVTIAPKDEDANHHKCTEKELHFNLRPPSSSGVSKVAITASPMVLTTGPLS